MNDLLRRALLVLMVGCCALAAEYRIIPAVRTSELTPAAGDASPAQYRDWPRSHGNNANARYCCRSADSRRPPPIKVNGRQYVVIAATSGGKLKLGPERGDAYVAFALP